MGCLFVALVAFFPRLGVFLIWLARPALFSSAFGGSWLLPVLGVIVLPFTTLMYVLMWSPTVGLSNMDWFWLFLAFFLDVASAASPRYMEQRQPTVV
jgi:hypothetical protein